MACVSKPDWLQYGGCMTPLGSADASDSLCCQGLSVKVNASLHMPTAPNICCFSHHKRSTLTHALSSTSCVLHRLFSFFAAPLGPAVSQTVNCTDWKLWIILDWYPSMTVLNVAGVACCLSSKCTVTQYTAVNSELEVMPSQNSENCVCGCFRAFLRT